VSSDLRTSSHYHFSVFRFTYIFSLPVYSLQHYLLLLISSLVSSDIRTSSHYLFSLFSFTYIFSLPLLCFQIYVHLLITSLVSSDLRTSSHYLFNVFRLFCPVDVDDKHILYVNDSYLSNMCVYF
jgi:hypothetical protein